MNALEPFDLTSRSPQEPESLALGKLVWLFDFRDMSPKIVRYQHYHHEPLCYSLFSMLLWDSGVNSRGAVSDERNLFSVEFAAHS